MNEIIHHKIQSEILQ